MRIRIRLFFIFLFLFAFSSVKLVHALGSTDVTGDGKVDMMDVIAVARQFILGGSQSGDVDQNQKVNSFDFSYVQTEIARLSQTPPPSTPSPSPGTSCTYPAQILNLTNWKETLPTGSSGSPTEILQPALATYTIDPYFKVNSNCTGVQFRAPTNGVTTSGSGYPRSELREMANNGTALASWSTTSGTHTMIIDQAIMAVPAGKKHIVAGQIHDSGDDVIVIRLEYPKLFIDINGNDGNILDSNYTLGKRFTVKLVATNGTISVYYNNSSTPAQTISKSTTGCYFKAGAYTQSNCSTESSNGATCGANNYGEVQIYNLQVTHQ